MPDAPGDDRGYRPIEDYAAIGDCHGGALVARDGGIDWCCLGRFDAAPLFARLLDAPRGGFLSTHVPGGVTTSRAYVDGTNVLRTEIAAPGGRVALTDFMPLGRSAARDAGDGALSAPGWLVRRIEVLDGELAVDVRVRPTRGFTPAPRTLAAAHGGLRLHDGEAAMGIASDLAFHTAGGGASASEPLRRGERRFVAIGPGALGVDAAGIEHLLAVTVAFWREWIGQCAYAGRYAEPVRRSALALKMLSDAASGATIAALTTSLPEAIAGTRNWDHRFCWTRDASLALFALSALGYRAEAHRLYRTLCRAAAVAGPARPGFAPGLQPPPDESTAAALEGCAGSEAVRVGNAGLAQHPADLHACVLEAALTYRQLGGQIPGADRARFAAIVQSVAQHWDAPDAGIWETRGTPRHFLHSKVACWVAVDRGIRLLGSRPEWVALRERILRSFMTRGRSRDGAYFQRAYDEAAPDAALLLLPMYGLPAAPQLLARTVRAVERGLRRGDLLQRYRGGDGLEPGEGAVLACSFWLVDALLAAGCGEEATALFGQLLRRANDVGLYAAQIDPRSGGFLGNFPYAASHLGLLASAIHLELFERGGVAALQGTCADRAQRAVGGAFGWRGLVAGLGRRTARGRAGFSDRSRLVLPRSPHAPPGRRA